MTNEKKDSLPFAVSEDKAEKIGVFFWKKNVMHMTAALICMKSKMTMKEKILY